MRGDFDLDNRSLVVKVLSSDEDVALPYRIEQMNGIYEIQISLSAVCSIKEWKN